MKRSIVVSLAVAVIALSAAGCDPGPGPQGPAIAKPQQPATADPRQPDRDEPPPPAGGPPGLAPGVVQIYRTLNGQAEQLIGCLTSHAGGEFWILPTGMPYPVQCVEGDALRFVWVDPTPADANADKTVTWQELLASTYATSIPGPKTVRQINEIVVPLP